MSNPSPPLGISEEDWSATPVAVRVVIEVVVLVVVVVAVLVGVRVSAVGATAQEPRAQQVDDEAEHRDRNRLREGDLNRRGDARNPPWHRRVCNCRGV